LIAEGHFRAAALQELRLVQDERKSDRSDLQESAKLVPRAYQSSNEVRLLVKAFGFTIGGELGGFATGALAFTTLLGGGTLLIAGDPW
jgi:hypothetical protein